MFFTSWVLWEQMTFVLGVAIVGVFFIGWAKLLWRNRLVQRQELVDEEKRTRIQQLRNSGQIVESRKSHDIPFGIRAIQSGIQVDGIWISRTATPIPSEFKLGHLRSSSTDNVASTELSKGVEVSELISDTTRPTSQQGRSSFRSIDLGDPYESQQPRPQTLGSTGARASYKPRAASHLRYGSHGVYDEETLGYLEGKGLPKRRVRAHRPRGSRNSDMEAESSAADNERSSGNSSDSDATLSHKYHLPLDASRQSLLGDKSMLGSHSISLSSVPSGRPVIAIAPPQSSKTEYFSIPIESPNSERSDPFATPLMSPLESPATNMASCSSPLTGRNWLDCPQSVAEARSSSPFIPGELHVNKVARKVNSGFEVLPAGTFGNPMNFNKPRGTDEDYNEDSGDRRQSAAKLQKKPRASMTGGRPSSAME